MLISISMDGREHCNIDDLTIYIYNSKQGYCDYSQILNRWRVNDNIGVTDWTYRVKKKIYSYIFTS